MITPPTNQDFADAFFGDNEDLIRVWEKTDAGYRHGTTHAEVYNRLSDDTYWRVKYRRSTDDEENGLRDGAFAGPDRVIPQEYKAIRFVDA